MFAKTAVKATEEFVKKLSKEMVMLALEAVELQERLDGVTNRLAMTFSINWYCSTAESSIAL